MNSGVSQKMMLKGKAFFTLCALIRPGDQEQLKTIQSNNQITNLTVQLNEATNAYLNNACEQNLFHNECKREVALLK